MAVDNWLPKPVDGKETGKMEAPLRAVDIRDTLNAYGGKVSNKTTSFFKPEANINKWSKHKPIISSKLFLPFDDEIWNSQDGDVPRVYTQSNLYNENVLMEVWNGCSEDAWFQYVLPAGGQSQPLRKGDFRGYRADATSPFKSFSNSESIDPVSGNVSFQLYIRFYLNDELEPVEGGMMSLFDIAEFDQVANYKVAVIDKYTRPDGYGNTTYTPYFSNNTLAETDWGLQEVSFTLGKINNTNEGIHEFAVALTDGVDYYYKLPFEHIKLEAEIYYVNDNIEAPTGDAYYTQYYDENNNVKSSGYVNASVVIHAGNVNTDGPNFSLPLYIGATTSSMVGPVAYGSVYIEKGKKGTMRINFNQNSANWTTYASTLRDNDDIYISTQSNGSNATKISSGRNVILDPNIT